MSESTDDWSHPEIVRNIRRLTEAVDNLVRNLDTKYVSREVHDLRVAHTDARMNELGKHIVDVAADQERHRREHASTIRTWVAPILTGAAVAILAVLVTKLIGG